MARFKKGSAAAKTYMASIRPGGSRASRKTRRVKNKSRSTRRVKTMAKKRTYRRRSSPSAKTLLKGALVGVGVSSMVGGGITGAVAGYLLGGVPGAVGGLLTSGETSLTGGGLGNLGIKLNG